MPSSALTTHLDLLAGLAEVPAPRGRGQGCPTSLNRTYRLQIGFADGTVTEIAGRTGDSCLGTTSGSGARVRGSEGLGVYGTVMTAFGRQYADAYPAHEPLDELTCPADPTDPGSVDADGASSSLHTGWLWGRRSPMLMPLSAVRGIVCTWAYGASEPSMRDLTVFDAERVRIGLHAINGAIVNCAGSEEPRYSAVVEDKTGTRRAVTVMDSACSTVFRSEGGMGLGFSWLDR